MVANGPASTVAGRPTSIDTGSEYGLGHKFAVVSRTRTLQLPECATWSSVIVLVLKVGS